MLQDASPRVLLVRHQDLRRINRGFYCCRGSKCLQRKATVIFRGTVEPIEPLLRTWKRKVLGELRVASSRSESKGSWPRHPGALVQTYWHRNAANLGQKPFLKATGDAAADTGALETQQHIKMIFETVRKSILTFSL